MSALREHRRGYAHVCPGCDEEHYIQTGEGPGPAWTFNGDLEKPTFTPSVRHTSAAPKGDRCCHYFITNGNIPFCGDCTHELAGKTVPLPEALE